MTSKERVLSALRFEKPDRMPFNFWMDRRLMAKYEMIYGEDFRVTHYGADVIETFPLLNWPAGRGEDRDGSYWYATPLINDWKDADSIHLPDPMEDDVYRDIKDKLDKYPDKAIFVNIPGPFTILHGIRLMDNLFYDMYDFPDDLHKLIRRIMDVQNIVIEKVMKWPVAALYLQDDVASSKGLMFSLPMIKEFIFSYLKDAVNMAAAEGMPVIYHSDGDISGILDTLLVMGIRAVNPLQIEFNSFNEFNRKFHGKLAVYGGIDNTKIIPDGSNDDIHEHVNMVFETLGKNGGLIMSSHDIPLHCPQQNIEIMVQSIKECSY